ncbi:MAG: hypothetical protein V9E94_04220 [Microthrixaceae bacterium]
MEYRDGDFSARHPSHLRRVTYSELSSRERESFLMTKLPVGYLIGADDSDVIEILGTPQRRRQKPSTHKKSERRNSAVSSTSSAFAKLLNGSRYGETLASFPLQISLV